MSHEIETMAYVGAVPWHGLGNPVNTMAIRFFRTESFLTSLTRS